MLYILETNLNENVKIKLAFKKIYGLNSAKSKKLYKFLGLSKNIPISDLSQSQCNKIKVKLNEEKKLFSSSLKKTLDTLRAKKTEIKRLKELRRLKGYPVNGQSTRTNGKTAKKKLK